MPWQVNVAMANKQELVVALLAGREHQEGGSINIWLGKSFICEYKRRTLIEAKLAVQALWID